MSNFLLIGGLPIIFFKQGQKNIRWLLTALPFFVSALLLIAGYVGLVSSVITAIRRAVTEQYGLPIHAVLLLKTASLPKTSSGKVQRSACRERFLNHTLEVLSHWKT
ncbi:MAG: hypothetical protein ACKO99_22385 [Dolichospermum sp.]